MLEKILDCLARFARKISKYLLVVSLLSFELARTGRICAADVDTLDKDTGQKSLTTTTPTTVSEPDLKTWAADYADKLLIKVKENETPWVDHETILRHFIASELPLNEQKQSAVHEALKKLGYKIDLTPPPEPGASPKKSKEEEFWYG